jgi:hypothetical protein
MAFSAVCERPMKCACCQRQQARAETPSVSRAPCCAPRTSHDAAPVLATKPAVETFDFMAVAAAAPVSLPEEPGTPEATERHPYGARAPPTPKCPIFLKNRSLLY